MNDTIEQFNVNSKAEYSALSSTRSQKKYIKKKKLKQTKCQCRFNSVQVKIHDPCLFFCSDY